MGKNLTFELCTELNFLLDIPLTKSEEKKNEREAIFESDENLL